jgi:hypothetical protein
MDNEDFSMFYDFTSHVLGKLETMLYNLFAVSLPTNDENYSIFVILLLVFGSPVHIL